ncbi:TPA: hypothetical protein ACPVZG_000389 [Vibrio parahaemolyticus]
MIVEQISTLNLRVKLKDSRLDPITIVVCENETTNKGKLIVEMGGEAWAASWSCIANKSTVDFITSSSDDYLISYLSPELSSKIEDWEAIQSELSAQADTLHSVGDITEDQKFAIEGISIETIKSCARLDIGVPNSIVAWETPLDIDECLSEKLNWPIEIPVTVNPEYKSMIELVQAVKLALTEHEKEVK